MADEKEVVTIGFFGPSNAGKTTLIHALKGDEFIEKSSPTVGMDIKFFEPEKLGAKIRFFDCAGEKTRSPAKHTFLQDLAAIYLVLDANKLPTKESLKQDWVDRATRNAPRVPLYLVINKNDSDNLKALEPQLEDLANIEGLSVIDPSNKEARWLSCSAKAGNIGALKKHIIKIAQSELDKIAYNQPKEAPQGRKLNLDDSTDNNGSEAPIVHKPPSGISKKKLNPPAKSFFLQFAKLFKKHFGTSDDTRTAFSITVFAFSGTVLAGAFAAPFAFLSPLLFALSTIGMVYTISCGIATFFNFVEATHKADKNRSIASALINEFLDWLGNNWFAGVIGVLLSGFIVAVMLEAVFFPVGLSVAMPFLASAIAFVGSGLAGIGLIGMSASATSLLAISLMGIVALTLWDGVCRAFNLIFTRRNDKTPDPTSVEEDQREINGDISTTSLENSKSSTQQCKKSFPIPQKIDLYEKKDATLQAIYAEFDINPDIDVIVLALDGSSRYPITREYDNYTLKDVEEKAVKEENANYVKKYRRQLDTFVHHYEVYPIAEISKFQKLWQADRNTEGPESHSNNCFIM